MAAGDDRAGPPVVAPGSQRRRLPRAVALAAPPHPGAEAVVPVGDELGRHRHPLPTHRLGREPGGGAGMHVVDHDRRQHRRQAYEPSASAAALPARTARGRTRLRAAAVRARRPSGAPRPAPSCGRPPRRRRGRSSRSRTSRAGRRPCRWRSTSIGKSRLGQAVAVPARLEAPPRPKKSIIGRSMRISGLGTPTCTTVPARSRA